MSILAKVLYTREYRAIIRQCFLIKVLVIGQYLLSGESLTTVLDSAFEMLILVCSSPGISTLQEERTRQPRRAKLHSLPDVHQPTFLPRHAESAGAS